MWKSVRLFFGDGKRRIWFLLNTFCSAAYLLWRLFFTIPFGYGAVSMAAGISLLVIEVLGMTEAFVHYFSMYNVRSYPLPEVPEHLYPHVDVFISTYNEEPSLLAKTILACKRMDYPDLGKVHIYLCDDGHREEMRLLAAQLQVHYLDRDTHDGAKAGNLNHALEMTSSPYIVTFDADMIPQSRFLLETIPYFVDAELKNNGLPREKQVPLGFVQTPQSFYDLDLFQFNLFSETRIPNEQDYFYKDIQVARTRSNSVIYGGSNTVISRQALEDVGGFYTKAITEDFATGILIEKKGYVSLGLGTPLASGMSPNSLQGLIQQRVRWARGVIATGRKMHIFSANDLTFAQKMNYWASVWYWYAPVKRLSYILSPMLYATFGFMVFRCTLPQVLLFWLPMYITSSINLKSLSGNIRSTKWTAIYETALFPFLLVPVLLESVGISLKKFKVTHKGQQENQKGKNLVYMLPFLILIVLSVIGIANCIRIMFDSGSLGPAVVLFWLVSNLFTMVMALFFVDGRIPYRSAERIAVTLPAQLHVREATYPCTLRDISEKGVSLRMDQPHLVDSKGEIILEIRDRKYHVRLLLRPVYVNQVRLENSGFWEYAFVIEGHDEAGGYDHLLGICYDRIPTHPASIRKNSGSYQDLSINMKRRVQTPLYQKRQYPRIQVDADVPCLGGERVRLCNFNYVYAAFSGESLPSQLTFLVDSIEIPCRIAKKTNGYWLYEVEQQETLYRSQPMCDRIMSAILSLSAPDDTDRQAPVLHREQTVTFYEMDLV